MSRHRYVPSSIRLGTGAAIGAYITSTAANPEVPEIRHIAWSVFTALYVGLFCLVFDAGGDWLIGRAEALNRRRQRRPLPPEDRTPPHV